MSPIACRTCALLKPSTQFSTSWVLPQLLSSMYHPNGCAGVTATETQSERDHTLDVRLRVKGSSVVLALYCFNCMVSNNLITTKLNIVLCFLLKKEFKCNLRVTFVLTVLLNCRSSIKQNFSNHSFCLVYSTLDLWLNDVVCLWLMSVWSVESECVLNSVEGHTFENSSRMLAWSVFLHYHSELRGW